MDSTSVEAAINQVSLFSGMSTRSIPSSTGWLRIDAKSRRQLFCIWIRGKRISFICPPKAPRAYRKVWNKSKCISPVRREEWHRSCRVLYEYDVSTSTRAKASSLSHFFSSSNMGTKWTTTTFSSTSLQLLESSQLDTANYTEVSSSKKTRQTLPTIKLGSTLHFTGGSDGAACLSRNSLFDKTTDNLPSSSRNWN